MILDLRKHHNVLFDLTEALCNSTTTNEWYSLYNNTYTEALNQIGYPRFENKRIINNTTEYEVSIPSFAEVFLGCIIGSKKIPTQQEFGDIFLKNALESNHRLNQHEEALLSRAKRAYISILREVLFNLYVFTNRFDVYNVYNPNLDYQDIDALIIKNGVYYGVRLYIDTQRGLSNRKHKTQKPKFNNVLYIDFPLHLGDNKNKIIGDLELYSEQLIDELIETLGR